MVLDLAALLWGSASCNFSGLVQARAGRKGMTSLFKAGREASLAPANMLAPSSALALIMRRQRQT